MRKITSWLVVVLLTLTLGACSSRSSPKARLGAGGAAGQTAPSAGQATDGRNEAAACNAPATKIHAVQGRGAASPLVGATVTIQGVVVGDFQRGDGDTPFGTNLGGYAVQEEDAGADGDPRTSEGVYVFDSRTDVAVGDRVRVTGRVVEFNGLTEISDVSAVITCASNVPLPTPARISLPLDAVTDLEAYEGMLVTFPQQLVIAEYFDFDRYGEVWLALPRAGSARPQQPTSWLDPRSRGVTDAISYLERSRILLDDGRGSQNPSPARHPNGLPYDQTNHFRGGDMLANVTGVLDHSFDTYRVQPTTGADYFATNPRGGVPAVGGELRVAAFNVLNYFEDFGNACGPKGTAECRGAANAPELKRQRAKIVAAISELDAHVVALLEIENDEDEGAISDLVAGLNAAVGAGAYAHVETGAIGGDTIRVAFIYQPAHVTPVGAPAVLNSAAFVNPRNAGEARNRPALAQTFAQVGGGVFTAVANHLKSKGSSCGRGDDDAVQGNCNLTRTLAAERLLAWLATDPTGARDPDYLILGDFNSYALEDPIRAALAGFDGVNDTADDLTDLLREFEGDAAYTFVFDGLVGSLDYAFATPALRAQVTGAAAWHINADEPDLIDYRNSFKSTAQRGLYAPDPYRSSDHDPVVVGLTLTGGH